jgi:very-short-patch-repair endonuclease
MREAEQRSRQLAKRLRRKMTDAEVILWSRLRRNAVLGQRFRRQYPVGPYVADFACVAARLVVEVDGDTHSTDSEIAHDRKRDEYLKQHGWRVLRVWNQDIYKNLENVLEGIVLHLPPPRPMDGPPPQADEESVRCISSPVVTGEVLAARERRGL